MDVTAFSAVVAFLSTIAAVGSAIYAGRQADQARRQADFAKVQAELAKEQIEQIHIQTAQARRQADAAHGDIEPNIFLARAKRTSQRLLFLYFAVDNFNRRPMKLKTLRLSNNHGMYTIDMSSEELIFEENVRAARLGAQAVILDLYQELNGASPGASEPSKYRRYFALNPGIGGLKRGNDVIVEFLLDYEWIDGSGINEQYKSTASFRVNS